MLSKEQAKAIADTIAMPREAEHSRKAELREQRSVRSHPMLRQVPVSERPALLWEARRYAIRRWTVIASLVLVIGAAIAPFTIRAFFPVARSLASNPGLYMLGLGVFFLMHRFEMNRFLKNDVPKRFPSGDTPNVISDA